MADRIKLLDLYINTKDLVGDLNKAIQTIEELARKVRLARQAFNQNKQAQDTLREGLKKLSEQNQINNSVYRDGEQTLNRLEKAEKELLNTLANEITALKKAQEQYGLLKRAADALNSSTLKQKIQTQELTKAKKRQVHEELGIKGAYDKLNARYIQAKKNLANLLAAETRNTEAIRQARAEYEKLRGKVLAVDRATNNYTKNIGNYSSAWKGFGNIMQGFGNIMQGFGGAVGVVSGALSGLGVAYVATAAIRVLVRVIKDGIKTVKEFEKVNATLAAVLQVEKTAISELRDDAIRLSKIYTQSAKEITELQVAFSRLGFSQNQILDVTEATIQGATALNSSLDETATLIGAVIKTFDNLSTTDAPHVLDVLSLATATSALNFEKLQTALPLVQGGANALGVSLEETVALLGKVVDKGIPASIAARALNRVFLDSAKDGLSYSEALETLNTKFNKFVAADENFGKRAAVTATVLANDIDKVKTYTTELRHAAGVTKDMADKELDTLDGQLHRLDNSWDDFVIALDDATGASDKLKESTRFLTTALNLLSKTINNLTETQLEKQNKLLAVYQKKVGKTTDTLKKYVAIATDTTKRESERIKAIEYLNTKMYDLNKRFTLVNINTEKSRKRIRKYRKELQRIAFYNVAPQLFDVKFTTNETEFVDELQKKLNELKNTKIFGEENFKIFKDANEQIDEAIKYYFDGSAGGTIDGLQSILDGLFTAWTHGVSESTKYYIRRRDEEIKNLEQFIKEFKKIKAANDLFTENAETNTEKRIGLTKAEYDLLQARLKRQIKQQDEIAKDETKNQDEREKAIKKRTALEIQSVNLEQRYKLQEAGKDLKNKKDIEAAKTKIVEDAVEKRRLAENKGTKDSFKINVDYLQKLFNAYEASNPSLIESGVFLNEETYNKEIARINDLQNREIALLNKKYNNRENDAAQEIAYQAAVLKVNQETNDAIILANGRRFSDLDKKRLLDFNNELETKRARTNAEILDEQTKGGNIYQIRQAQIDLEYEQQAAALENQKELEIANAIATGADIQKIKAKYNALEAENDKKHAKATNEIDRDKLEAKLKLTAQVFGAIADLTKGNTAAHKAAAIAEATINTLVGVTHALKTGNFILAGSIAVTGATTVAKILATKTNDADQKADQLKSKSTSVNIGGYAEKGGVVKGKSHAQGGVAILAEGQEGIINKKAMKGNIPVMELFKLINYGDYLKRSTVVPQPSYFNQAGGITPSNPMQFEMDYDTLAKKIASANAELLPERIGESTAEANAASLPTPEVSVKSITTQSTETNDIEVRY